MHNNIMAAGSKDRPPMLGPGRYSQWRSRFLRYIDTKPNGGGLKKSILSGPYVPTTVQVQAVEAAEGRPAVPQHTSVETILNMTPENKEHFQSEKEAIFLLLTGIGDEIYSNSNLFWNFRKLPPEMENAMESVLNSQFYKLMNVLTRTTCKLQKCKVNVQLFFQQLQAIMVKSCDDCVKQSEKDRTPSHITDFSDEDSDPEQAQRDNECKRIWHPLQSISRSSTNLPTTNLRYFFKLQEQRQKIPHQVRCATDKDINALTTRDLGTMQKEWQEPKRLSKLMAEDTDEEIDEHELEAHYSYMAKIQEVSPKNPVLLVTMRNSIQFVPMFHIASNFLLHICTTLHYSYVNSGAQKHNDGQSKLCVICGKFLGTVRFGNDQFAPILGYGDLIQGNVTIKQEIYLFCERSSGKRFTKPVCRESDLVTISLQANNFINSNLFHFMAKASPTQAWLWHRRLSHLNFDYITLLSKKEVVNGLPKLKYVKDQLCLSCEMSKAKRSSFKTKAVPSSKGRLNLLHMDLCGPMRVASINGKKYILVIVDDYSRYTWTLFLRSKDETPEVLKDFLTMIQRNLQAQVITVRTDRGTEFLNKTLHAYFKEEGIEHQTSTPRTPEQNGVVERRNRTLVEAARTMLSASKLPLSFWAEAVATACYTQNRSIIISTHGKTAYHIINDRKPSIKHLHIFGCRILLHKLEWRENWIDDKKKGIHVSWWDISTRSKGYSCLQQE
ncbi:retrovirus-related pol polyprotein from transposon TNT 1-94 [Tanacetum coccineum]